jgi:hypothetical protein
MQRCSVQQCPTCGKQLDTGVRFCPDDGTPLTDTAARTAGQATPTGGRISSIQIELPAVLGNRYRLTEVRGGGGMAKVFRAIDTTLEREVAIKLINPELRAEPEFDVRFQREARIASQLADPHIVVVHDFGLDATFGPYLVMEYLQGQSLRERLQTAGPLPLKAALQMAGQLFLALIHAHDKGIVHRDIKPDNIFLLNQSGVRLHVRVLDFGIARIYRRDEQEKGETLTRPGAVLGTPRYMSPEQLAGQPVDARSDLYSAAAVIHEALTGKLPYVSGKTLCELCSEAPPVLQDLLDHCLKQNPEERPAGAIEVYLRLQELGKASGVLLLPPGAMDKLLAARQKELAQEPTVDYVPKPRWRRWLPIAAATLGALLLLGLGIWGLIALFSGPTKVPVQEALGGITIGATRDDVIARFGKAEREHQGNPWRTVDRDCLGRILQPLDLDADSVQDPRLNSYRMLVYDGGGMCVVLRADGVVRAMVVHERHKAATARGVDVGNNEGRLVHVYASEAQKVTSIPRNMATGRGAPPPRKLYRYDRVGVGFDVLDEKVTAITLYPPMEGED